MNGGAFNFLGGTLHVATLTGNLVNQGGTLAPGHSAGSTTIAGNYTQQSAAKLDIEIGGLLQSMQFDFVNVTGNALLDGDLELTLFNGFVPGPGDVFTILNSTSAISQAFSNAANGQRLRTVDSEGSFLVHYGPGSAFNPNQIVLSAFQAALTADFDNDGAVDGDDLTLWTEGFGEAGSAAHGEGDADGDADVDGADFLMWQRQLGISVQQAASAVPEPATAVLLMLTMVGWRLRQGSADEKVPTTHQRATLVENSPLLNRPSSQNPVVGNLLRSPDRRAARGRRVGEAPLRSAARKTRALQAPIGPACARRVRHCKRLNSANGRVAHRIFSDPLQNPRQVVHSIRRASSPPAEAAVAVHRSHPFVQEISLRAMLVRVFAFDLQDESRSAGESNKKIRSVLPNRAPVSVQNVKP